MTEGIVRYVRCFCGKTDVVSRRAARFDPFAVCSPTCFSSMLAARGDAYYDSCGGRPEVILAAIKMSARPSSRGSTT